MWFGPLTFAVYLIHDNSSVRNILWNALLIERLYSGGIMMYLCGLVVIAPVIFIVFDFIGIQRITLKVDLLFDELKGRVYLNDIIK